MQQFLTGSYIELDESSLLQMLKQSSTATCNLLVALYDKQCPSSFCTAPFTSLLNSELSYSLARSLA